MFLAKCFTMVSLYKLSKILPKMTTYKIYLRTDQQNIDGTNTVFLRLIINRKKSETSLQITALLKDWDCKHLRVKKSDKNHLEKNKWLTEYEKNAQKILYNFYAANKQLTHIEFKKLIRNETYGTDCFYTFVLGELNNRKGFSKQTLKTYKSQITKLKQFKPKLNIQDINHSLILDYKDFMVTQLQNKTNTVNKSLTMLKTFVFWAVDAQIVKENPFTKMKFTKVSGNRQHLNLDEIKILESVLGTETLTNAENNVLRYFLFACYTGLRFTDVKNFRLRDIYKTKLNGVDTETIKIDMHKTGLPVEIPLIQKAKTLFPPVVIPNKPVFKVLTNQKTNNHLKTIMQKSGIEKQISFHCSRHSLATNGISLGIPVEVVSKLLGHTDLKTTMIYAKVSNELKQKEMNKFETNV